MTTQSTQEQDTPLEEGQARALARELGCFLEDEVCALLRVVPATTRNWRTRRTGPDYIHAGNVVLYPISNFSRFLKSREKKGDA